MFCLDTNVVIAVIGDRSVAIRRRLREEVLQRSRILLPAIVLFELRFGIAKSARRKRNEQALEAFLAGRVECPAFDGADAAEAADIRTFLERNGTHLILVGRVVEIALGEGDPLMYRAGGFGQYRAD